MSLTIYEIIEIIKETLKKDKRVKICHKYQAGKALQIQLHNNDNFNLRVIKLDEKAYKIMNRNS